MAIKKLDDGRFEVDIRPIGRNGKRIRRRFDKKTEAVAFERYTLSRTDKKEWQHGYGVERRQLSELVALWWLYHGQNAKNGLIEHRHLKRTVAQMNDPEICRINKPSILEFRTSRLSSDISASTINRDMYRLSGMFSVLIKLELYAGENPLRGLPPLKEKQPLVTFFSEAEIAQLLATLEGDEYRLAVLCLSMGARWGEASTLRAEQVLANRVMLVETKNGKNRAIPISEEVKRIIKTRETGRLFNVDYVAFCERIKAVKPDIPKGQASHILRHTFASHFVMNGGNLVALQQILGHASIQQTMVYAHLAPDYLENAITLNPLRGKIAA
ncbi:tyrosine-type recombinase/integrase [Pectobacterium carotovorum]|uniref:phage integrase n=1 Tax=Pectobacterium carotovorum TaxID=554 RepID=UPI00208B2050|nr:tyrosine-type recombinase/integrase [Pectobacterium carotovorum]GKV91727.1 integrase [Pectobacterium carotovorum subsp. carotovorum]GLW38732.1 integrase [Pectobacterium carotovorum subsp. carotovorum]